MNKWKLSGKRQAAFAREQGFSVSALRRWIHQSDSDRGAPCRPLALKEISVEELLGCEVPVESRSWEFEIRPSPSLAIAVAKGTTAARIREGVEASRC